MERQRQSIGNGCDRSHSRRAERVRALAEDPGVLAEVQNDVNLGNSLRINSTPSIFLTHGMQRFPLADFNNYSLFRSLVGGLKLKWAPAY